MHDIATVTYVYFRDISKLSRLPDFRCNDMKILDAGIVRCFILFIFGSECISLSKIGAMNSEKYLIPPKTAFLD